jgi:glycine/D-amino acid oxidase-like deaminating enzyme
VTYHLVKAGLKDVVLVEREPDIASVTTGQAAGNAGQVRRSVEQVRFEMTSVATYRSLQRSGESVPSWRETGSIRIALSDERVEEFRMLARTAAEAGLEVELIEGVSDAHAWPHMRLETAKAILWCPTDGYFQPVDLARAYQHHARKGGAKFSLATEVVGIDLNGGAVAGVLTNKGRIECETVINCGGWGAWKIAKMVGLDLPIFPVRHQYMISTPLDGVSSDLPTFRVPDLNIYGRPDVRSLLIGGWETQAVSLDPHDIPAAASSMPAAVASLEAQAGFVEAAGKIYPPVRDAGMRMLFSGWPTATPDGRYVIGRTKHVPGFVMAAGCNIHGVGGSAGFGRLAAEAVQAASSTPPHLVPYAPDRFEMNQISWESARKAAAAISENYYNLRN